MTWWLLLKVVLYDRGQGIPLLSLLPLLPVQAPLRPQRLLHHSGVGELQGAGVLAGEEGDEGEFCKGGDK